MAGYPDSRVERRVAFATLHAQVTEIFRACGMTANDALQVAYTLAWADLRGIHSHGVLRAPDYVAKLREQGVNPKGRPRVVSRLRRAALVVDGGNSMGQVACHFAMRQAIAAAAKTGVAAATVRGSNHCGAMAYFAMQALEHGMIGIATTNALPTMAPWGGKDKIVGINPLAVALPATNESPVVLDCAFSYSSHGKIRVFAQKGAAIPPTWAFDRNGRPTRDATKALDGLLQPIGEYKGVGLGVVFGLLSTALSGASYGTSLGNMVDGPRAGCDGQFLMAIDIAAFTALEDFTARVDAAVEQIRNSRPVSKGHAAGKLYAPGGLEAELEKRYRAEGIPLNRATLAGIDRAAIAVGLPPYYSTHSRM